ncbi:MAG: lysine exporter LysO family protein, partial [Rectinema sp.]|nr:lysine exporter LysO family protein [Rectinema sp.]
MTQILVLLGFLAAGALLATSRWAPRPRIVESFIRIALWLLLFSMGFRIGNSRELVRAIGTIGIMGLGSAATTIAGSCFAVFVFARLWPASGLDGNGYKGKTHMTPGLRDNEPRGNAASRLAHLKAPGLLLAIVTGGFIVGMMVPRLVFDPGIVTEWTLNLLLFLIGIQFRQSRIPLAQVLRSPALLLLPVATAIGSLLGGLLLAPLFSLRVPR